MKFLRTKLDGLWLIEPELREAGASHWFIAASNAYSPSARPGRPTLRNE
jgi:hypothetical protein